MTGPVGPFPDDVVSAICDYMNGQQPDSCMYVVRHALADESVVGARLTGFDTVTATFSATWGDRREDVTVPWLQPAVNRGQVRQQLVLLWERAVGM